MSFMMVDRLPVPKLSTYVSATVLSISAATYYSVKYSFDASNESADSTVQVDGDPTTTDPMDIYYEQMLNVLAFMLQDPLCFLVSPILLWPIITYDEKRKKKVIVGYFY